MEVKAEILYCETVALWKLMTMEYSNRDPDHVGTQDVRVVVHNETKGLVTRVPQRPT